MKEVDAIDHEDDDLKWAPDLFYCLKKLERNIMLPVIGDVLSPIQNPLKLLFPTYQSLFSKLHVLHRKGPTLSTSTRAPVFHWKNSEDRRRHRWSFGFFHTSTAKSADNVP